MAGVNKAILVGRLGGDPEIRYTPSGAAVANFTVATSENWKDKDGQKQEKTEWHKIVAFAKLAEICGEYLHKGKQVYIEGRIQTRKWEDKDGNNDGHFDEEDTSGIYAAWHGNWVLNDEDKDGNSDGVCRSVDRQCFNCHGVANNEGNRWCEL